MSFDIGVEVAVPRHVSRRNPVWDHFEVRDDKGLCKCKFCRFATVKSQGPTRAVNHLKCHHPDLYAVVQMEKVAQHLYCVSKIYDTPDMLGGENEDCNHAYDNICNHDDDWMVHVPTEGRQRDVGRVMKLLPWTYGVLVEICRRIGVDNRVDMGWNNPDVRGNDSDTAHTGTQTYSVERRLFFDGSDDSNATDENDTSVDDMVKDGFGSPNHRPHKQPTTVSTEVEALGKSMATPTTGEVSAPRRSRKTTNRVHVRKSKMVSKTPVETRFVQAKTQSANTFVGHTVASKIVKLGSVVGGGANKRVHSGKSSSNPFPWRASRTITVVVCDYCEKRNRARGSRWFANGGRLMSVLLCQNCVRKTGAGLAAFNSLP